MTGPKASNISRMFNSIAGDYDKLNHLFSLGIDKIWRRRAVRESIDPDRPQQILDIACGTGDFTIDITLHACRESQIRGMDLSQGMLDVMARKVEARGLSGRISTQCGNCEKMDFDDDTFDVVTIGFGIRNFEHREVALKEILRILKPGGKLVILELSMPRIPIVRGLYKLYFLHFMPWLGGLISGDKAAYRYLPASVVRFPRKKEWMATMEACGFVNVKHTAMSLGINRMYIGEK